MASPTNTLAVAAGWTMISGAKLTPICAATLVTLPAALVTTTS